MESESERRPAIKPASPISKNASLVITGAFFLAALVLNAGAFFPDTQDIDSRSPIFIGGIILDSQDQKGLESLASGLYKGDDIMQYGNWYGPGWWGGDRKKDRPGGGAPVDGLDAVAQRHDFGYKIAEEQGKIYGISEERRLKALADYMAVRDAKKLDPDPSKWKPPAADPTRADEYRNRMITGFTYEAPVYEGAANAGKALDWVTSPMDNWELDRGQQLDASDLERFVKINIKSWNKNNPQTPSVSTDEEDWTEGQTIEVPDETTVEAGEGSENEEVKGAIKPTEEPKAEAEVKPGGEEKPPEDEVKPEDGETPPEDEVKPEEETPPEEEEVKPEDEEQPEDELVPPTPPERERKPKEEDEVKPEDEGETEDEPEEEPEEEPEAIPEPGDSVDNADGSTTTTKGYVENKDGRITIEETRNPDGSVTTTTTETDRDGQIISETTYGESGEGKTTRPDNDLRDAEPESDADVDVDTASGGVNTSGSYGDNITEKQQQRSADGSSTMAQNTQMDEASNVGNQQTRDARTTRDSGGREAQITADAAARNTAKSDRENSWGKAIGDGVEAGITEGATAMGSAFGSGAADVAIGAIFGPSKEDSDSSGDGTGKSVAAGTAAAPSSGGGSTKGKKKPKGNRGRGRGGGGGSDGGGSSGGEDGDILVSTSDDIPVDGTPIDDPIGVTDTTDNDDGTITITYGCGYTWTGTPPGPSQCPVCSRETVSTESSSPSEEEEIDDSYDEPEPEPKPEPDCTGMTCGRCGYCPCPREPPDPGDEHIICWFHCPKCGWRMAMSDGSGL